ncbi:MAG: hypothetical protein ABIE55_04405 [Candidatus Aenigmatarchaeota archaeon]
MKKGIVCLGYFSFDCLYSFRGFLFFSFNFLIDLLISGHNFEAIKLNGY